MFCYLIFATIPACLSVSLVHLLHPLWYHGWNLGLTSGRSEDLSVDVVGSLWPIVYDLHVTLILDENSWCGNSLWHYLGWQIPPLIFLFQLQVSVLTSPLELQPFPVLFHLTDSHLDLVCVAKHMVQMTPWALKRGDCPKSNPTQYGATGWLYRYHSFYPFPGLSHQIEVKTPWNPTAIAATLRIKKPQLI